MTVVPVPLVVVVMVMIMIVMVVMIVVVIIVMSMMFVIVIMPMIMMIVFPSKRSYREQRGSNYRANQSKLAKVWSSSDDFDSLSSPYLGRLLSGAPPLLSFLVALAAALAGVAVWNSLASNRV